MLVQKDETLIKEFWERIDNEINKQHIQKKQLAERCRFNRHVLFNRQNYMCTPYFARLCKELHVSADYLLFGEEKKGV